MPARAQRYKSSLEYQIKSIGVLLQKGDGDDIRGVFAHISADTEKTFQWEAYYNAQATDFRYYECLSPIPIGMTLKAIDENPLLGDYQYKVVRCQPQLWDNTIVSYRHILLVERESP
jgi:hypothetical protein